ncbi:WXG100 family type VII secretion target [Streptomyces sp. NBC_00842]|uniref:WXG100 family type VII secretion target n=1 Tax=unclassified Streptomyces TaxID=2593676 RepID=UPI00386FFD31
MKRMIAHVSELWVGEAREACDAAQAGWDRDATAILTALSEIARKVRKADFESACAPVRELSRGTVSRAGS